MGVQYTTTQLVEAIRRRGSIPSSQQLFTANDLIDLSTDEMETVIVPYLMGVREEYFVAFEDFDLSTYSSTPVELPIPTTAIGQKLRDVCWVDDNGSITSIPRYDLEQASGTYNVNDFYNSSGFMIRGNYVVMYPSNSNSGTIRMYYFKRPLVLTATTNCGQIQSIDSGTNEVTLSFLPSDWVATNTLNAINQNQPFDTTVSSVEITTVSFSTVTLASVTGLSVGDWIALEGYSPIPQLPIEAHKVLAQATVVKCMESMGDDKGMAASSAKLGMDLQNMYKLISPRVDGAPKKVTTAGNGIFDQTTSRNNNGIW